jgi:hypothetical protein
MDNSEQLERILLASLARAIDFVKFAETKNAALLAFASAWALAVTTALSTQPLDTITTIGLQVSRTMLVVAIVTVVLSFRPRLTTLAEGARNGWPVSFTVT